MDCKKVVLRPFRPDEHCLKVSHKAKKRVFITKGTKRNPLINFDSATIYPGQTQVAPRRKSKPSEAKTKYID